MLKMFQSKYLVHPALRLVHLRVKELLRHFLHLYSCWP